MSVNLDRFSQGLPDPQEAPVMATCEACGGEIYEGELIWLIENEIIHYRLECLERMLDLQAMTVEEGLLRGGGLLK